jgi:hypothetical protein
MQNMGCVAKGPLSPDCLHKLPQSALFWLFIALAAVVLAFGAVKTSYGFIAALPYLIVGSLLAMLARYIKRVNKGDL